MSLEDLEREARRKADQATGALEKLREHMQESYGVSTLKEADNEIVKMKKEATSLEAAYNATNHAARIELEKHRDSQSRELLQRIEAELDRLGG